jgi:hypothetical protein
MRPKLHCTYKHPINHKLRCHVIWSSSISACLLRYRLPTIDYLLCIRSLCTYQRNIFCQEQV